MQGQPPVVIEPYDPQWPGQFESERELLEPVLAPWLAGPLEHIGSTAVPGMPAKPIIDILGPVHDIESSRPAIEAVAPLRYCYWFYKDFHWFCKPSDAERTHHLHLIPMDSRLYRERIAFRDRLRSDPPTFQAYLDLKRSLAERFREDREAYTEAKTEFIQGIVDEILGPA